jgi:hypothetical protein|tara:strand:+ start:1558 stop:2169 length:612 start_codon:yes stop_codon:yes gene_type:complete
MTEKEVLEVIEKIASKLCYKFKFGYHDVEDMKQQARFFAIQGIDKYDGKRPLENFLWTHVRNRLFNYKRDNYERPDNPCPSCPFFDPNYDCSKNQCEKFQDKSECDLFYGWHNRNTSKKNIMAPVTMSGMKDEGESILKYQSSIVNDLYEKQILDYIDDNIPINLRKDFIRFKNGLRIPKARKAAVLDCIEELMEQRRNNEKG